MDLYLEPASDNKRKVTGLKNKFLTVQYHSKLNGTPVDLTKRVATRIVQSKMRFLSDSCTIRSDGTIPDYNIIFGGTIGRKRVGSQLPSDYKDKD